MPRSRGSGPSDPHYILKSGFSYKSCKENNSLDMAIKDKENREVGYGSLDRSEASNLISESSNGDSCYGDSTQNSTYRDNIDDLKATVSLNDADDHSARALTNFQRFSYGVGHVLNDLTASMWFSYLLIFLQKVDRFENVLAGNLMLIGQVTDALCTPFIGFESDQTRGIWKLGKRKTWHLVGTFSVMASFVFLFSQCITCSNAPSVAQFVYYTPFVVIFQFGWAATQISHLSYSSDITPYKHERVTLQSVRNSFTVIANLSVYGLLTLLFFLGHEKNNDDISPDDAHKFRYLALTCIAIGIIFNGIFYFGTKNCNTADNLSAVATDPPGENSIERSSYLHSLMSWRCWLKQLQFHQVAILYMSTRLYINISQVYFPMYLIETVGLSKSSIAIFPLVSYVSSFITSLLAASTNRLLGRKTTYAVALGIGLASCVWMYFIQEKSNQVYGCAILMGSAGSLMLITSLSMTSDLIGSNVESGAFVFGAMSFTDKLSNGVAVLLIQFFHPCTNCCPACYYRKVQTFVPGGSLICGFIMLLSLLSQDIGVRDKRQKVPSVYQPSTSNGICNVDDEGNDDDERNFQRSNSVCQTDHSRKSPIPPSCDAVTHHAEVYSHVGKENCYGNGHARRRPVYCEDDEEGPLLGSLNTQRVDVGRIS
ncbi:hypothetical protein RRG08_054934 [Elysia crispata]|uniref:Major facilitator superfamily domain-containing protein 12 n=1 Tax=Elysia crispata TaxID=231223 RepID=A0AAE0YY13_9GAST|nr:hypothetical protein RRG08_054934 [Elysia crispata]